MDDPSKLRLAKNIEKRLPDMPIKHHILTNKHFGEFTPKFQKIANKYGLKLNQPWNIVDIPLKYHKGRHSVDYHKFVEKQLYLIDEIADGNKSKFLELVESNIKSKLLANPSMLNKN